MLALAWQDHAVIVAYLAGMLALGVYLARRQRTDDEYFLGGRRMPWFAVGLSVIASLLSSLTYLSEPGEVWKSGVTHFTGKMLAIPFEMVIVWLFCIPFMMRFRFTSAYEYLEHRFGYATRLLGVGLFILMVVLWMGFVVLASSRALEQVSGVPLWLIIGTVGVVATVYTMLGGLRAVIWTDVVQVVLLVGGGLFAIGYVAVMTGTGLSDWYAAANDHVATSKGGEPIPWFSTDPAVRATIVMVAVNMFVWHLCTHTANQMTVQRYFSTSDVRAARRSFVTGSLAGAGLNAMLVVAGLAVLYFYLGQNVPLDGNLNVSVEQDHDLIFPTFAVHRLPPGLGGAILAALLAAAMSSIDSGVNSIATVLSVEVGRNETAAEGETDAANPPRSHVRLGQCITLLAGLFITGAAFGLTFLPKEYGIVDAMPRTFNAVTAPLGGLFLIGMFLPFVRAAAAFAATLLGMATSIVLGYWSQITSQLAQYGWLESGGASISFTWIMPSALCVTILSAAVLSTIDPSARKELAGLTWWSRRESSGAAV